MKSSLLIVMLLISIPAWAAGSLEIKANTMALAHQKRQVEFKGSVFLQRDNFILYCDRLIAYYKENTNELERADAFGHVRMQQGDTHGTSDKAKLDYIRHTLTLIGHAIVNQSRGQLEGETIVHDIRHEKTMVISPQKGKARLIIEPDKSGRTTMPVPDWGKE